MKTFDSKEELSIELQAKLKTLTDVKVYKTDLIEEENEFIGDKEDKPKVRIPIKFLEDLRDKIKEEKITALFFDKNIVAISKHELYWILNEYNKIVKDNDLGLEQFTVSESDEFTLADIELANSLNVEKDEKISSIVINDVIEVEPFEEYLAVISYKQLKEMYDNGMMTYNFETQREASYVATKYGILIKPTVYENNVDSIAEKMLEGDFKSNLISLNALKIKNDTIERYRYNERTRQLQIFRADIIDGFHRQLGCMKALSKNPNLDGKMYLRFTNYDIKQAMSLVKQESLGVKISDERITELGDSIFNDICDKLNNDTKSALKDMFGNALEVQNNLKVINKSNFINSLSETFVNTQPKDKIFVQKYLIEFYNVLVGFFSKDFDDPAKSKLSKVVCDSNMFALYNYIAAKLYDKDDWEDYLMVILDNTNWDNNNTLIDMGVKSENLDNKRIRNKLYNYGKVMIERNV